MNRAERRRAQKSGQSTNPLAITWYSNASFAPTGYGTQTKQVVHRLQDDGHAVAIAANYGLQATQMIFDDIPHYPMGVETYSNDVIEPTFQDWSRHHPDLTPLVIALFDAWPLKAPSWDRMPVAIWTMIDHLPAPPAVLDFLRKPNVTPLAASRFAQEQITKAGIESIYVPMAIDTDLYKPTASWHNGDRDLTGRELMGFGTDADDYFIFSCINANKSGSGLHRKAWGENLLAFSIFAEMHDDVRLYIHTERNGHYGGVNFSPLLKSLDIPEHKYRFVNQWAQHVGIPNEAMAALFSATDCLLAPTLGEGFGLTVLEAGACGTPAIVSDFTCQPELVSDDSWLVGGQPLWDSHQAAWWQIPNVGQIVEAMEAAYQRGRGRSEKQRAHALQYDAALIYETHWKPALEQLANQKAPILVAPDKRPEKWVHNDVVTPTLGIYIPAYQRATLSALLASLAPQLTDRVEVIVSDDDPTGSAWDHVTAHLSDTAARVDYSRRRVNLGPDANLLRGLEVGRAPWIWQMGDDDAALPGAVARILAAIDAASPDTDRIILLSESYTSPAAGMTGAFAEIAAADPSLPIATTLITANVVRRDALDLRLAHEKLDTMYACSWANTSCRTIHVLPKPCIEVGTEHVDGYVGIQHQDIVGIWTDLLRDGYGLDITPSVKDRNYVNTAQGVA